MNSGNRVSVGRLECLVQRICLALAVTAAAGARPLLAEDYGVAMRYLMTMRPADRLNSDGWRIFNDTVSGWPQMSFTKGDCFIVDVGSPHVVSALGVIPYNGAYGGIARAKDLNVYGSNDTNDFSTLVFATEQTTTTEGVVNYFPNRTGETAYRYYKVTCSLSANLNLKFFSKDLQVSQERSETFVKNALGDCERTDGTLFTGTLLCLPDGGTASAELLVARTDHDDDYDAWIADATLVRRTVGGLAQGDTYELHADGLAAGRWHGRVFAVSGSKKVASQCTSHFAVGTSAYWPTAYVNSTTAFGWYDGNLNTMGNSAQGALGIVFALTNIDVEVVGYRIWPYGGDGLEKSTFNGRFCASDTKGDFGAVTESSNKARPISFVTQLPVDDWRQIHRLQDLDLFVYSKISYCESSLDFPMSHPRYLRLENTQRYLWSEIEFRTLPRPATPEATMALGTVGGTYAGISGHLVYRGNAASDCSVHVSCVEPGSERVYRQLATGWQNDTDWSGSVTSLKPMTEYELTVVISNALEGAEVLATTFTTAEAAKDPPGIEFLSVTPSVDGTVDFSWRMASLGTDATSADVYARWGVDGDHLCEGVRVAEGVSTGVGNASCATVTPGTDLVFVLYAVGDSGLKSEETAILSGTTFGPSALGPVTLAHDGEHSVRAGGSLSFVGPGTTHVYANWGATEGALDRWQEIAAFTVASGEKSFTAAFTPEGLDGAYCRVVASNSYNGVSWGTESAPQFFLFGTKLPFRLWQAQTNMQAVLMHDGNYGTHGGNIGGPVYADLGSPHPVRGVRVAYYAGDTIYVGNLKTFSVWMSDDLKTWRMAWSNSTASAWSPGECREIALPADTPAARYLRFSTKNDGVIMYYTEFEVVGGGLAVRSDQPTTWGPASRPGLLNDESRNGIYYSGQLVCGGPAHVWAVAGKRDCGNDLALWQARGCVRDLGEFNDGELVSGWLNQPGSGVFVARLLAVKPGAQAVSPEVHRVACGCKPSLPPMYVPDAALKAVYDGNLGTLGNTGADCMYVFPLESRDKRIVEAVRLWPLVEASQWSSGWECMSVYLEMTEDDISYETTELVDGARRVCKYTAEPSATWHRVGDLSWRSDFPIANGQCWDIPVTRPLKNPKFLRVRGISRNFGYEVELRCRRPGGMYLFLR